MPRRVLHDQTNCFDGEPIFIRYNGTDHYQALIPANSECGVTLLQEVILKILEPGTPINLTFFGSLKKQQVIDNRHNDIRIGHEYDKRFGLIVPLKR